MQAVVDLMDVGALTVEEKAEASLVGVDSIPGEAPSSAAHRVVLLR